MTLFSAGLEGKVTRRHNNNSIELAAKTASKFLSAPHVSVSIGKKNGGNYGGGSGFWLQRLSQAIIQHGNTEENDFVCYLPTALGLLP